MTQNNKEPGFGDYVLATKFHDGEAWDHWAVGFYAGSEQDRHFVNDSDGNPLRAGGFRRVGIISKETGAWLLGSAKELELSGAQLWELVKMIKA